MCVRGDGCVEVQISLAVCVCVYVFLGRAHHEEVHRCSIFHMQSTLWAPPMRRHIRGW